jgi:hypothetical protein
MARVQLTTRVSLQQAETAIATIGAQRTVILRGEPGIGKSWLLKSLGKRFPEHKLVYLDCQLLLDQGDFFYPFIETTEDGKVAKRVPLEDFNFDDGKPVIIMLDEIGKSNKAVMNVLLTIMYDRRLGNMHLPAGSIVFATTNMASDGVGDFLAAHVRSRAVLLNVKKPHAGFNHDGSIDNDSWGHWALGNGIAPELLAWVKTNQHCLDSYLDFDGKDKWSNPYAFHPTQGGESYVCPRSLHAASDIIKQRTGLGSELTLSMLAGTAGESFARDVSAFFVVKDRLTSVEAIVAAPDTAPVPEKGDAAAQCVMVFNLITATKTETIKPFITYIERMPKEFQAMFARSAMASDEKQKIAVKEESFRKWAMANHWMF